MKIHGITGNLEVDGILSAEELQELNSSQLNDVSAVRRYWQEHGYGKPYPLIIKPTGYGKGRVIDALLHPNHQPGKALLIVGTKNILVEQNQESLRSLVFEETGETRFSILPDARGPVVVATWQSLNSYRRYFPKPPEIDLAIVDEVHNAGTRGRLSMLRWLSPKKVVGLTATAYRASGIFRTPEHYGFQLVEGTIDTLPACIDKKWLSPLMGLCIDTEVILPRDVMTGNAISGKKLYREMRHHPDLFASIAEEIGTRFLPTGMKTIVVVNRVMEEACVIYKGLERMGFKVGLAVNQEASRTLENSYLTNGSIERYRLPNSDPDSIQVLISPLVIGEGFDAPATECVVWASPTSSSLRYTQVMGRGARRCPGKAYCLIVDFVYLIEGYGYSMNFAQFFKRKQIKELEGGFMYVGPGGGAPSLNLPYQFTQGASVVSIVELDKKVYPVLGDWLTRSQLRKAVDRSYPWIERALARAGAVAEFRFCNSGVVEAYPPSVLGILVREIQELLAVDDWVAVRALARKLGKSESFIHRRFENLRITPEKRRLSGGTTALCLSPAQVTQLTLHLQSLTEQGDWLVAYDLSKKLGHSRELITKVISELALKSEERMGQVGIVTCYPPESIEIMKSHLEKVPAAGDWITFRQLEQLTGQKPAALKTHLKRLDLKSESRRADKRKVLPHYSPQEVARAQESLAGLVPKGDFLTLQQLSREIGKSPQWCKQRLGKPEKRWTKTGGLRDCYSPSQVEAIKVSG